MLHFLQTSSLLILLLTLSSCSKEFVFKLSPASTTISTPVSVTNIDLTGSPQEAGEESIINLPYTTSNGELATSCSVSTPISLTVTTPCSCDLSGVCTTGITSAPEFSGDIVFDYNVTTSSGVQSDSAQITLHIDAPPFVTVWETTNILGASSTDHQITIPLYLGETYDFKIDWGDGVIETINTSTSPTHTYATPGSKEIKISGIFPRIYFNNNDERLKILEIKKWGSIAWQSFESSFYGCSNLEVTAQDVPNLSGVTHLTTMFFNASAMTGLTANWNWNTSLITHMNGTFQGAAAFNGDISSWNTDQLIYMGNLFNGASVFNQNIGSWNTANVTDMGGVFNSAAAFNQDLNSWNTTNVITMNAMFAFATNFNGNISSWNTANVTDMGFMFTYASHFNRNISSWNTTNVTNMSYLFSNASDFNQDISSWNTANVTAMNYMFGYASDFNQDISGWNTSNVTTLEGTFFLATSFNQDVGSWNTSNVTNMAFTFANAAAFNQDISSWDTSNVTTMYYMFPNANLFNQDLTSWVVNPNVANCTNFGLDSVPAQRPNFLNCSL